MKIKIDHISNTYNYGSLMMAVTLINILKKNFIDIEIYVDCLTDEDLDRVKIESGCNDIKFAKNINEFDNLNKINRKIKEINKESDLYDVKIIIGGDDISEYYGKKHWIINFPLMYLTAKKLPIILLGQSIGPFTNYRRILARLALNKVRIYTRDNHCLNYLYKLGVRNVINSRDLAFLDLPMQSKANHILDKYKIRDVDYIVIVPSGLTKCYTNNIKNYINQQLDIIMRILNNTNLASKKIVLLPHVLLPEYVDDRVIIREIMKNLDSRSKERIIAIDDSMLPTEAREILGNGLFTITGRMHAAVSTFYMRKPAISLSYSVKYAGVIGDGLDMNELVIESSDNKLWENGEISKLVDEKINFILNNYDGLLKKIDIKVTETSNIVEDKLSYLVDEIKKINNL